MTGVGLLCVVWVSFSRAVSASLLERSKHFLMGGDDLKVEGGHSIEEGLIGSKPRTMFTALVLRPA